MALFVGLDVSLRTTSICVVEADGSTIWEGKAESEPAPLVKTLTRWRLLWESKRLLSFRTHQAEEWGIMGWEPNWIRIARTRLR
jgi:hypothetical protein